MQRKKLLMVIIGVCAIAVGAWFFFLSGKISPQNDKAELSAAVVRVNGEEIARAKLKDAEAKIAMGQGIDVASLDAASLKQLETQALDALIANALIQQAVANSGIAATGAEIDAQMTIIKSQFQDDSQFKEALSEQKLSESDLRSQV
ncbi:MAG: SurA N-terminal domain-containing protein, partial [bacterium]|nr:SurA N-terminal domain-containing protein [bacterium]